MSVFCWAKFRSTKAAIKLHTVLDLKTSILEFAINTNGKVHDVNILDMMEIEKGGYYIMDKGYIDFTRLYHFNKEGAFFVVQAKENLVAYSIAQKSVRNVLGVNQLLAMLVIGKN